MSNNLTPDTQVYYINLDDNIERKKNIESQTKSMGFTNVMRINAVDTRTDKKLEEHKHMVDSGAYDTLKKSIVSGIRKKHEDLTRGAVGCFLSHYKIYQHIVQNKIPKALVLEDDTVITLSKKDFWNVIDEIHVPDDADIYLYDSTIFNSKKVDELTVKIYRFFGMHMYLITYDGAVKALEMLIPIVHQIDSQLSFAMTNEQINIYGYNNKKNKRFAKQDTKNHKTTIQMLPCKNCLIKHYEHFCNMNDAKMNKWWIFIIVIIVALIVASRYPNYNFCRDSDRA